MQDLLELASDIQEYFEDLVSGKIQEKSPGEIQANVTGLINDFVDCYLFIKKEKLDIDGFKDSANDELENENPLLSSIMQTRDEDEEEISVSERLGEEFGFSDDSSEEKEIQEETAQIREEEPVETTESKEEESSTEETAELKIQREDKKLESTPFINLKANENPKWDFFEYLNFFISELELSSSLDKYSTLIQGNINLALQFIDFLSLKEIPSYLKNKLNDQDLDLEFLGEEKLISYSQFKIVASLILKLIKEKSKSLKYSFENNEEDCSVLIELKDLEGTSIENDKTLQEINNFADAVSGKLDLEGKNLKLTFPKSTKSNDFILLETNQGKVLISPLFFKNSFKLDKETLFFNVESQSMFLDKNKMEHIYTENAEFLMQNEQKGMMNVLELSIFGNKFLLAFKELHELKNFVLIDGGFASFDLVVKDLEKLNLRKFLN